MAGRQQTTHDGGPVGRVSGRQSPKGRIAVVVLVMTIFAVVNGVKLAGGLEGRTPAAIAALVVLCVVPLGLAAFLWRERR